MEKSEISKQLRKIGDEYDELRNKLAEYIKERQGEKGYISTNNADNKLDTIYVYEYDDMGQYTEHQVFGVKVNEDGDLFICHQQQGTTSVRLVYSDDDFKNEENWELLYYCGYINYYDALYNIAEVIDEYVSK